jgi:putative transposase
MNLVQFPENNLKKMRTTTLIERINEELKRRSRVIGAFHTQEPLVRLAISILIDITKDWITGNKY